MAVAAADFYTYARATGTPLPKSKQEEAQLAPAVDKWKKSRLNNTRQEEKGIDAGQVTGLTAALAGIGASVVAARNPNVRRDLANLVRPGKATSTNVGGIKQDLNVEPVTIKVDDAVTWDDVKQRSTPNYEVVEKGGAGVRSDFTQPVVEKEVKTFSPYDFIVEQKAVDPETAYVAQRLRELQTGPKALESLADEQIDVIRGTVANPKIYPETTSEIRRQNARARAVLTEEADLVRKELLSDQSVNAIDAAEDQETGRVVRQLQRNEDIDQTAVAIGEERFESQGVRTDPIDAVAESLPDGPPVIQSEQRVGLSAQPTAQEFLEQTKLKITPQQYDYQAGPMPPKIRPEDVTEQADGINYFNPWAADQEDIIREHAVEIASGKVPGGTSYKDRDPVSGYLYKDIQDKLLQDAYDQKYSRTIPLDEPGNPKTSIVNRKNTLTQSDLNKMNQVGITGTRIAGPSNVQSIRNNQTLTRQGPVPEVEVPEQTFLKTQLEQRLDKLQQETTELKAIGQNLERAGQLMSGGTRAVNTPGTTAFDNAMAADMVARAGIKPRITSQYYQKNISLPKTMRQAVDTGETDPGRIIDTKPKGGGGRKVTAYNPDYQQLSTVGPYGIERANYPRADITKRPTEMPISPRTGKPIQEFRDRPWPPSSSPEVAKEGMKVSEDLRAIYNSGRPDAQQQADAYIEALRKRMGN